MTRFIHSADWQLGARFSQFGAKGKTLREARVTTLRHALEFARQKTVDAFLVAGDLFEDNQVDESLVAEVVSMFSEFASVPIYILPGNHDPYTGPDSVWQRRAFAKAPTHIHILAEPQVVNLGGAWLLASPLQQKLSTSDPSLKLINLAANLPTTDIKIGITHGALAINGKHQPNDFPIALNAATRANLDYLAIGHWHNWLPGTDGGRIVMPGTPEPDGFDHERCGQVAYVEIAGSGQPISVAPVSVATLTWRALTFDFLAAEASRATVAQALSDFSVNAARTVVRVTLIGTTSPAQLADICIWLDDLLSSFLVSQVIDHSSVALTEAELLDLQTRHPILAQVLTDIDQIETFATGQAPALRMATHTPLSLTEAQALLAQANINLAALTPEHFRRIRRVLLESMQEVAS